VALTDGVKRVNRLINQMRFLARDSVEPGDAFPLAPLIEEAYQEAQKHQPVKSAKLLFEPGNQPTFVTGDRAALKHALAEVMLNALQANPADPRITVRVSQDGTSAVKALGTGLNGSSNGRNYAMVGRSLEIEIQDNGTGFSPEAMDKVPEPFFTTRNVGLGLGMTVSRKIIETHRGQISILSPKTGQSGIVRISLPAGGQAPSEEAAQLGEASRDPLQRFDFVEDRPELGEDGGVAVSLGEAGVAPDR
jgi:signal transduction histidine kinase